MASNKHSSSMIGNYHKVSFKLKLHHTPPKSGHGGKFTWEVPMNDIADTELSPLPLAIGEGDPNYVDEEVEERILKGEELDVDGLVVGEVEATTWR
uniref:Uncharacterized protein n=1 Tax=Nelumbo nucifera TaxID=4432 RepID=A0A822XWF7_NELNU|nr:TPA_asm: hypothetical protein HUJ06_026121 [Nelumbo nucifera]